MFDRFVPQTFYFMFFFTSIKEVRKGVHLTPRSLHFKFEEPSAKVLNRRYHIIKFINDRRIVISALNEHLRTEQVGLG